MQYIMKSLAVMAALACGTLATGKVGAVSIGAEACKVGPFHGQVKYPLFPGSGGGDADAFCPVTTVPSSRDRNANNIKSFDVYYLDSDGNGPAFVSVDLIETGLGTSITNTTKCQWNSNNVANPVSTPAVDTVQCDVDFNVGSFYYFKVRVETPTNDQVSFVGIEY